MNLNGKRSPTPMEVDISPTLDPAGKRRRISNEPEDVTTTSTTGTSNSAHASPPMAITIPDIPLLYHTALAAHHASHHHYQQIFIPSTISTSTGDQPPLHLPNGEPYTHDPKAEQKSMGLLLLSMDLLRIGLDRKDLTFAEQVAFGMEFGIVGMKLLDNIEKGGMGKGKGKGREEQGFKDRLVRDLQDVIGNSLSIAHRNPQLKIMAQTLEVLSARLTYQQNMVNLAKRMLKQTLKDTSASESTHRYTLLLLHSQMAADATEAVSVLNDLIAEAGQKGHVPILLAAILAKLRILFIHRRWDSIQNTSNDLAQWLGWTDPTSIITNGAGLPFRAHVELHYLFFRCLWEGRIGNDSIVKMLLKKAYGLMDEIANHGTFDDLRCNGGVIQLDIPNSPPLLLQLTTTSISYMLTFLVTIVSRRDYLGKEANCKHLMNAKALREFIYMAKEGDVWDLGCELAREARADFLVHSVHSPGYARSVQREVLSIQAEALIEEITATAYRMDLERVDQLCETLIDHLRQYDLFGEYAPHVCLLYGIRTHLLGLTDASTRYYFACRKLGSNGSEMDTIVKINLFAVQGHLCNLAESHAAQNLVKVIAEQCLTSSSAGMQGVGLFLSCLAENNLMISKKRLSNAYDISLKANNNILRVLVFAFTTSTHLTGSEDRIVKQMETGREIAALMGGKDREDGVGQIALGLWFTVSLKRWYRMHGKEDELVQARQAAERHLARLTVLTQQGRKIFGIGQISRLNYLQQS